MEELKEIEIQKIETGEIIWNYDQMKSVLTDYAERYRGIVVTEESLKGCQLVQRELAGMRRALDEKRKEVKRELQKPVAEFDQKAQDLIGIITEVENPIKEGIGVFEEARRQAREDFINETFENTFPEKMPEKFKKIEVLPSWLNKTTSDNELVGIIVGIVQTKTKEWEREESDLSLITTLCSTASEGLKNKIDPKPFVDRYFFGVLPSALAGEITAEAGKRKSAEAELIKETVISTLEKAEERKAEPELFTEEPKEKKIVIGIPPTVGFRIIGKAQLSVIEKVCQEIISSGGVIHKEIDG